MTVENISIEVKTNADRAATKINALSLALERLEGTARTTQGAAQSVSNSMNSVAPTGANAANGARSAARSIDNVAKSAKKAQSPLETFISSLKRIAFYRFLRTILKEISQAIKEGLENVYEWSKAGGDMGEIAGALDRITSAGAQLKNQLGAAFGELLVALEPIIIALINLLTQLAQALTWVIALLSGKGYYPVAKQITKDWKEATGAANAYKNTILGFDEINRLNDTNGGGGGDAGGYSGGLGFDPFDLDWKFPEWFAIFKQNIDDCIGKTRDFVAELATIPDLVEVEIAIKDPLPDPLLALEPMLANIPVFEIEFAILGNPIPLLNSIRLAIANLVAECPQLQTAFQTAYNAIADVLGQLSEAYAQSVASIQIENSTLGQDVIDTYNRLRNPLDGWISHFWEKVGEYQQASGALQLENETLAQDMRTTFETIKESVRTGLEGAKANVSTFVTQTLPSWVSWCNNVAENAMLAMENVATNIWASLQNAADNIVSFVNNTAQGFVSWAQSAAQSVFAWASNVLTNIGNALRGAWESIKSFAQATGEAIGGFFKENAQVIIPAAIGAAIVIGAIALAPPTGGASLAAIALAANGGVFPNDGTLFVAGEQGAEIVSNMGSGRTGVTNVEQMKEAVREGNFELLNVVQGGINIIVQAINEIDPDITLDGESLADKMHNYNQNAAKRRGPAMVT